MTFGPAWWLRPDEQADIGTPFFVVFQASVVASILSVGFEGPGAATAFTLVLGGFFALLALRNSLRLLLPRPVATTAMLVSLTVCASAATLSAAGPILETDAPLRGILVLPALSVLLTALAQESVRKVNLKQA
ncbi:hypothetical protein [Nocardioides sp. W7]|uniref:hypothetical protein n=1 Tax=Nocardioides sp. W7 TaxID=2931390 RepID=UPI001FD291E8|nr:hypothetical protein [Nocardioides sp. W7]